VLRLYSSRVGTITELRATQLNWPSTATVPGVPSSPTDAELLANPPRSAWGDAQLSSSGARRYASTVHGSIRRRNNPVLNAPPVGGTATNNYYVAIGNSGTAQAGTTCSQASMPGGLASRDSTVSASPRHANPVSSYSVAQSGPIGPGELRRLGPATWTIDRATYVSTYQSNPGVCSLIQLDADNSHPAGVHADLDRKIGIPISIRGSMPLPIFDTPRCWIPGDSKAG